MQSQISYGLSMSIYERKIKNNKDESLRFIQEGRRRRGRRRRGRRRRQ